MSGLLQRLAGQALGGGAGSRSRIRAAASVHAQVPVGFGANDEVSPPGIPSPAPSMETRRESNARSSDSQEHETDLFAVHQARLDRLPLRVTEIHSERSMGPGRPHEIPTESSSISKSPLRDGVGKLPERLLGEAAPAPAPAFSITPMHHTPPLVAPQPHSTERAEPTEVHVHIGRIEVTAVQEASAPPKQRTTPRATRALSEYLARRSRA